MADIRSPGPTGYKWIDRLETEGLKAVDDQRGAAAMNGSVERHERLGGTLKYYYRKAA